MSEFEDSSQTTLNIPQLVVLIVIGFLVVRWFLAPQSPAVPGSSTRPNAAAARATARNVETIIQMFPQLDRRTIMWDLQRNGNNVQMTTERVLTGRGLDTPPQSFQPVILQSATTTTAATPIVPTKSTQPDLLQRYKLTAKLQNENEAAEATEVQAKPTWSTNKTDRQISLQKRREEMILAARRKLQTKDPSQS